MFLIKFVYKFAIIKKGQFVGPFEFWWWLNYHKQIKYFRDCFIGQISDCHNRWWHLRRLCKEHCMSKSKSKSNLESQSCKVKQSRYIFQFQDWRNWNQTRRRQHSVPNTTSQGNKSTENREINFIFIFLILTCMVEKMTCTRVLVG